MVVVGAAAAGWLGLRLGPAPGITIDTSRSAIGAECQVHARFAVAGGGLGSVRLELIQGDRNVVLAEKVFPSGGVLGGGATRDAEFAATVGRKTLDWLKEGDAVLRATASRSGGFLRRPQPSVAERRLPVRLRPPRLELLSKQHYLRQGGSGVVVFKAGDSAVRSGVHTGVAEFDSYPLPDSAAGERACFFVVPWEAGDVGDIRVFAEDDAGNRHEQPFVDLFKPSPPRSDTIELTDPFLARVVPEIASQTPGFDASGSLLDQYLRINGEQRRASLARIVELSRHSAGTMLWHGAFLQMPNTQRRAGFAEKRSYVYQGRVVDHQTHLGLDLASTARAPVPAANSGKVVFAGWLSIYGNAVVVDHGLGVMSLYGHLSSIQVSEGQTVEKSQTIAASGSTGLAGGDHLHLEIFVGGFSASPIEWLDEHWIRDNIGTKVKLH
jgi:hypothetical protein